MSYFSYKAINVNGAMVSGLMEADDMDIVYDDLAAKNFNVLSVKKSSDFTARLRNIFSTRKVKRIDIIEYARNLSIMLKAGIPLLSALEDSMEGVENKYLRSVLIDVKSQVELGKSFSDALALHKKAFPDIFIRLAKVGESTGRLDKSFTDVADHLQRIEDLSEAIKRALFYPIFTIVTTTGALIFWLVYVLPKIMTIFKDMKVQIPLLTRILMKISNAIASYWYLLLIGVICLFILIQILRSNEKTRYYIDLMLIRFPIVKLVIYNKLLALFTEQMRILIIAGVMIDRAFDIVGSVIGNLVFKKAITSAQESISLGSRISDALRQHDVFPPLLVRMVNIGETSGNLDAQFSFLSEYYIKRLDDISQKLGKLIEPILITVVGIVFVLMIMAILFPVYELVAKIGRF